MYWDVIPCSNVFLGKLIVAHLPKKFSALYGISRSITVYTTCHNVPILSHIPSNISSAHFDVLLSS
jgi:hypothetical protein